MPSSFALELEDCEARPAVALSRIAASPGEFGSMASIEPHGRVPVRWRLAIAATLLAAAWAAIGWSKQFATGSIGHGGWTRLVSWIELGIAAALLVPGLRLAGSIASSLLATAFLAIALSLPAAKLCRCLGSYPLPAWQHLTLALGLTVWGVVLSSALLADLKLPRQPSGH